MVGSTDVAGVGIDVHEPFGREDFIALNDEISWRPDLYDTLFGNFRVVGDSWNEGETYPTLADLIVKSMLVPAAFIKRPYNNSESAGHRKIAAPGLEPGTPQL